MLLWFLPPFSFVAFSFHAFVPSLFWSQAFLSLLFVVVVVVAALLLLLPEQRVLRLSVSLQIVEDGRDIIQTARWFGRPSRTEVGPSRSQPLNGIPPNRLLDDGSP